MKTKYYLIKHLGGLSVWRSDGDTNNKAVRIIDIVPTIFPDLSYMSELGPESLEFYKSVKLVIFESENLDDIMAGALLEII